MCITEKIKKKWKEIFVIFTLASVSYFLIPYLIQPQKVEDLFSLLYSSTNSIVFIFLFLIFFFGSYLSKSSDNNFSDFVFVPTFSALLFGILLLGLYLLGFVLIPQEAWDSLKQEYYDVVGFELNKDQYVTNVFVYGFSSTLFESFSVLGIAYLSSILYWLIFRKVDNKKEKVDIIKENKSKKR